MKKVQFFELFLFCLSIVLLVTTQDIYSFTDLFSLHAYDYLFIIIWSFILSLPLFTAAILAQRLVLTLKKIKPAEKKSGKREYR